MNEHAVGGIGHEFIGMVEAVGDEVKNLTPGEFVIAPFTRRAGAAPTLRSVRRHPGAVASPAWRVLRSLEAERAVTSRR